MPETRRTHQGHADAQCFLGVGNHAQEAAAPPPFPGDLALSRSYRPGDLARLHFPTQADGFRTALVLRQPLASTLVYQLIFGKIAQLPTNNIPPFLFYMSGIVIRYYFSACLSRTSTTFSANAALFTKVYFPATDDTHRGVHKQYLAVPDPANDFPWLLSVLPGKGRSHSPQLSYHHYSFPGPANRPPRAGSGMPDIGPDTRFRDLQVAVAPMIQLWMYASCVFYPRSMVPDYLQWIMTLNPVVPIIEAFRFALMGQGQVEIYQWLASLGITFLLLIAGIVEFGRAEKTFADTI